MQHVSSSGTLTAIQSIGEAEKKPKRRINIVATTFTSSKVVGVGKK